MRGKKEGWWQVKTIRPDSMEHGTVRKEDQKGGQSTLSGEKTNNETLLTKWQSEQDRVN